MRACIQRVTHAQVGVGDQVVGSIGTGLLVLLGIAADDTPADVRYMADKTVGLRLFEDSDGKMNRSLLDVGGAALIVSQFTLLADARKGRRPSFVRAAPPELANQLYEQFCWHVAERGVTVARGQFRAHMRVELVNDGPVTLLLDSQRRF